METDIPPKGGKLPSSGKGKINWLKKPCWQDWIMLSCIVFALLMWWFYKIDMANVHAWYQTNCICLGQSAASVTEAINASLQAQMSGGSFIG